MDPHTLYLPKTEHFTANFSMWDPKKLRISFGRLCLFKGLESGWLSQCGDKEIGSLWRGVTLPYPDVTEQNLETLSFWIHFMLQISYSGIEIWCTGKKMTEVEDGLLNLKKIDDL